MKLPAASGWRIKKTIIKFLHNYLRNDIERYCEMPLSLQEILEWLDGDLPSQKDDELTYACIICGNHPFFLGHIEKSNPNRLLDYSLCVKCYNDPNSHRIAEKIINYYETTVRCNPSLLDHWGEC